MPVEQRNCRITDTRLTWIERGGRTAVFKTLTCFAAQSSGQNADSPNSSCDSCMHEDEYQIISSNGSSGAPKTVIPRFAPEGSGARPIDPRRCHRFSAHLIRTALRPAGRRGESPNVLRLRCSDDAKHPRCEVSPTASSGRVPPLYFCADRFDPVGLIESVCRSRLARDKIFSASYFQRRTRRYPRTIKRERERVDYKLVMETRCFA